LVKAIYRHTKEFPSKEQFGITDQIRRASVSVVSNLAEGSSRKTKKEQARFSQIAYSSLMELLTQIILSFELGYLTESQYNSIREDIEKISYKLNQLHNSQINHRERPA
jgi:four helix bundle protein